MRIAHVITRMVLGGAQENTLLTCRDLVKLHSDDVLLITGPAVGPEGSLMERVAEEGIPHEVLPALQRSIHPGRDTASYFAIKRALRHFKPEVVHTHSAKGGFLGRLAAHALKVPAIVHTVHGAPFHPYQGRGAQALFKACERYAARRCHQLVSVADAMTDLLVNAGVAPREKFVTVYSGMEVEPFLNAQALREETRRRLGYLPEHIVVGKVARLFHLKGHEYLIRAAQQVVKQSPHVRILLVGDGILREELTRQIAAAKLTKYFQFTGLVPSEEIPALMGAMDIVAHVSLREGLARVLPQALISGRPAISYDIDGAREVVISGETGFLLPPQSVDELAAAIVELSQNDNLRAALGSEGRRRFTEQFRHEHMTRELRAIYARLL